MTTRFWELLAKYWSGSISGEEKAELDELLLQHPGDWLRMGQLDQLTFEKLARHERTDAVMDKVMNAISAEQPPALKKGFPSRLYKWSLLALMGIIAALLTWLYLDNPFHGYKVVATEAGMKTKIRLPDGSIIWLNAGSTLKYPEKMDMHKREVYLTGEAFFDIKHAANSPFIIHAHKMDIRVLGTSFNIRSYNDEDFEETAVISGAVEVTVKDAHRVFKVTPNQKVVLTKTGIDHTGKTNTATPQSKKDDINVERQPLSPVSPTDSVNVLETAWMNNQLIFRNETLASLSQRLERWYGVKIIIRNQQLSTLRFSGRADNVPIEKLLDILRQIQPFSYTVQDAIVTIK